MGDKAFVTAICGVPFIALVLQAVGFFTPKWISTSECDSLGLFYQCCGGSDNSTCLSFSNNTELYVRVTLGVQATSLAMMVLTFAVLLYTACSLKKDEDFTGSDVVGILCIIICYPIAGLASIIGCIVLATQHSTSELGYSFALCATSGCFVLLVTICLCGVACYAQKHDNNNDTVKGGELSDISSGKDNVDVEQREVHQHHLSSLTRYLNVFQHRE